MTESIAIFAAFILFCLTVFQVLLIVGLPLGRMAWGGAHEVLPRNLRIASASSVVLYVFFALVVLSQAGVLQVINGGWVNVLLWVLVAYFFVGVVMNAISRSKPERMIMTPAALLLALSFLYVALNF